MIEWHFPGGREFAPYPHGKRIGSARVEVLASRRYALLVRNFALDVVPAAVTNGIPRCNLDPGCTIKPVRYARAMHSAGNGIAAWVPLGLPSDDSWERNGVMIGDVGFLNLGTGAFSHLFNIFYDAKHHAGSHMLIPDNFVPIQPPFEQWDVKFSPEFFPKDTIIASEGVNITRTSEENLYVICSVRNRSDCSQQIHSFHIGSRRSRVGFTERWFTSRSSRDRCPVRLYCFAGIGMVSILPRLRQVWHNTTHT